MAKVLEMPLSNDLSPEQALGYMARRAGEIKSVLIMVQTMDGHYVSVHGGKILRKDTLWLLEIERERLMRAAFSDDASDGVQPFPDEDDSA